MMWMNVCMRMNIADYNMQFYTKWLFSFIYGDPCIWPDLVLEAVVVGRIFERLQQTPIISNLNEWRESAVRHKSPGEKHRCNAERNSWGVAHDFFIKSILKKHFLSYILFNIWMRWWRPRVLFTAGGTAWRRWTHRSRSKFSYFYSFFLSMSVFCWLKFLL